MTMYHEKQLKKKDVRVWSFCFSIVLQLYIIENRQINLPSADEIFLFIYGNI
jgi:hypothetical protein